MRRDVRVIIAKGAPPEINGVAALEREAFAFIRISQFNTEHLPKLRDGEGGYTVRSYDTGPKLLADMESGYVFDLLLTDVMLPGGMNGNALAAAVRHRWPLVKVLYSSGYTENAVVHQGRLDPGAQLLHKPFRKTDLARKVRSVLDAE